MKSFYEVLVESAKAQGVIDRGMKRVNEARSGVSHELFLVAQDKAANKVDVFLDLCADAEEAYKASKGKRAKVTIPKQWTQAKSNLKGALNEGFNLSEYDTESALRKAVIDKRKEDKGVNPAANVTALYNKLVKAGLSGEANKAIDDVVGVLETMIAVHAQGMAEVKKQKAAGVELLTANG